MKLYIPEVGDGMRNVGYKKMLGLVYQRRNVGYTTEGIEIVQVPGAHHNNLTKSPHVQMLAEQLKLCLNLN